MNGGSLGKYWRFSIQVNYRQVNQLQTPIVHFPISADMQTYQRDQAPQGDANQREWGHRRYIGVEHHSLLNS